MRAIRNVVLLLATAAAATIPAALPATAAPAAAPRSAETTSSCTGGVVISGNVADGGCKTAAELAALPQRTIAISFNTPTGRETHTFTGPLLLDVLTAAHPRFATSNPNDKLRYAVLANASDGAQVTVAWGEFDPDGADKAILLALGQDGQPLAAPRLGIPIEKTGGRDLAGVCSLRVGRPLL